MQPYPCHWGWADLGRMHLQKKDEGLQQAQHHSSRCHLSSTVWIPVFLIHIIQDWKHSLHGFLTGGLNLSFWQDKPICTIVPQLKCIWGRDPNVPSPVSWRPWSGIYKWKHGGRVRSCSVKGQISTAISGTKVQPNKINQLFHIRIYE